MDHKDKYIKYKSKYINLKYGVNLIGGAIEFNNKYQEIIYEISKYLKPHMSNKFKDEYGMKQLTNQVIELNKIIYLNELRDKITDYYITDKIDGKRTILYLSPSKNYGISDKLETLTIENKFNDICILDTEAYNGNYYIFDVMVFEGKSLVKEPFKERMKYFDKFTDIDIIKNKPFVKLNNNFKSQIKEFKKKEAKYETDGVILTPNEGSYDSMKVYKYKPLDHLTVDFLIKKCPDKLLPEKNINSKNTYLLFCGISKRVFYKLRMNLIKFYVDIFPNININNLPQYFPIQFEPSSKKDAYYYYDNKNDLNDLDGEVGEFLFNIKTSKWELKRLREDRKIEVERGNYFGNNYKIAELTWISYENPLVIEEDEPNDETYFQEHNNQLQKASRSYNSFVKSELFKKFKGTKYVIDLASGKGQDLFRYSQFNMENVLFLEIDKIALMELISRKHSFAEDKNFKNNMNILIQNVDLLDTYEENINKISNVYKDKKTDLIICNFAFHYLLKNKKSLKNICELVNFYLKKNGKFMFTSFDGEKIINLLNENNGEWTVKVNNQIKYSIKKKFTGNKMEEIGQKVEVLLPFSNKLYYEEFIVNIETICEEFEKYGIVLETNESFSKYVNSYKGFLDFNDRKYVNLYHYYIFTKT
jgi:SAM-dependent methyltransferase